MRVLRGDTIIIGDGETVLKNGALVINDQGCIEKVGLAEDILCEYTQVDVIDYGSSTILPGLIDTHVHIAYWQMERDQNIYKDHPGLIMMLAAHELQEALKVGVTTIRCVTEPKDNPYCIKMAINKGFLKNVPRYISCLQGISSTGGHGTQVPDMILEVDSPYDFRKAVRSQIKAGADWIKVLASHRSHMCEITQEELNAAADESHRWLKKCCIHAGTQVSIEAAIEAGFDTIEHGTFMTVEQALNAKEKGIGWVPTIYPYWMGYQELKKMMSEDNLPLDYKITFEENYSYFEACGLRYEEYFKKIADTGILIATGTDAVFPSMPITPVVDEMKLMHAFGLSPLKAIQCATANAAKMLDLDSEVGLLKEGLMGDILIVDGDASLDLNQLKSVKAVYRDGYLAYKEDKND